MVHKVTITIDVIVHATEDISKIIQSFEIFNMHADDFAINQTSGYFDNPITIISAKIQKKQALDFTSNLFKLLSAKQISELIEQTNQRVVDSHFHIRLDKQDLINKNVTVLDDGAIKLRIHTPIYNKKDTTKIFTDIFAN